MKTIQEFLKGEYSYKTDRAFLNLKMAAKRRFNDRNKGIKVI